MTDLVPTDSGSYECRIMVRETVSISHTLLVSQSFSVQVDASICFFVILSLLLLLFLMLLLSARLFPYRTHFLCRSRCWSCCYSVICVFVVFLVLQSPLLVTQLCSVQEKALLAILLSWLIIIILTQTMPAEGIASARLGEAVSISCTVQVIIIDYMLWLIVIRCD